MLDKNNEEIDLKQDLDDDVGFNGGERYQEEDDGTTFQSENVAVDSNLRTALLWNIQIFQRKMISADCWMNSLTLVLMITKIICNKGRRGRINGI